jgi:hypothetical protein
MGEENAAMFDDYYLTPAQLHNECADMRICARSLVNHRQGYRAVNEALPGIGLGIKQLRLARRTCFHARLFSRIDLMP